MWRPWSKLLELLGGVSFPLAHTQRRVGVGDPEAPDALGGFEWRRWARPEALHELWGPVPGSPWVPFHCVPLFAALERVLPAGVGPRPRERVPEPPAHARPGASAPSWAAAGTWVIADLPGELVVPTGAWLVEAGCQAVCTFDNWPHPAGVLRPEEILSELLFWAPVLAQLRPHLEPGSPPAWLCDRGRLGQRPGRPGEFDNRYYLDDSLLPGPGVLQRAGIRRAVYLTAASDDAPLRDVGPYFERLGKAGIETRHASLEDPALGLAPLPAVRGPAAVQTDSYRRSSAGGFGTRVPQPSEGSGSSG